MVAFRATSTGAEQEYVVKSRPTNKGVAAQAGVSLQTVSRVINHKSEISPETRARVLGVIDELGYRPSAVAQSMVAGRTRMVGCISPKLIDYTFACIVESAQAKPVAWVISSSPVAPPPRPMWGPSWRRCSAARWDGLLIVNPYADGSYRYFPPMLKRGMAVVYLANSPHGEPISSVRCDDRDGGYQATRCLIGQGHTAIATIVGPKNEECTFDRLEGYRQALFEPGLPVDTRLAAYGDYSATSGYRATRQLLEAGPPFSALYAQNDQMAVGALRALREADLQVPRDVSVIGFDDIPLASYSDPPLTTFRQPMEESGKRAACLLIQPIQNPKREPEQVFIPRPTYRAGFLRVPAPAGVTNSKEVSIDRDRTVMLLLSAVMIYPFFFLVATSLKDSPEVFTNILKPLGERLRLDSFATVLGTVKMGRYLVNTAIVAICVTLGQIVTSILGGYAFARICLSGRSLIFRAYLGTMMIPFVVLMIPTYKPMLAFGWVDKLTALIVPWLFTAYGTFLMRQFFLGLPNELEEAATIDGASRFTTLWRIFVPLAGPAIATQFAISFRSAWNSWTWPLVAIQSKSNYVATLGLADIQFPSGYGFRVMPGFAESGKVMNPAPPDALYYTGHHVDHELYRTSRPTARRDCGA